MPRRHRGLTPVATEQAVARTLGWLRTHTHTEIRLESDHAASTFAGSDEPDSPSPGTHDGTDTCVGLGPRPGSRPAVPPRWRRSSIGNCSRSTRSMSTAGSCCHRSPILLPLPEPVPVPVGTLFLGYTALAVNDAVQRAGDRSGGANQLCGHRNGCARRTRELPARTPSATLDEALEDTLAAIPDSARRAHRASASDNARRPS